MKKFFNLTISIIFLLLLTFFGVSVFYVSNIPNDNLNSYNFLLNDNDTKNYEYMGDGIIQVNTGTLSNYALIDTDDDISNGGEEIWAWGDNTQGQTGTSTIDNEISSPRKVYLDDMLSNGPFEKHILSVNSNQGTAFAIIDTDGDSRNGGEEIWGWGRDRNGNIGIELSLAYYKAPQKTYTDEMLENEKGGTNHIIELSIGNEIQAALIDTDDNTSNGGEEIWVWGKNDKGQIGVGNIDDEIHLPEKTTTSEMLTNETGGENHILNIESGDENIMAVIDTDGDISNGGEEIWGWGNNSYLQINETSNVVSSPEKISFGTENNSSLGSSKQILQLTNNTSHSMILINTDEDFSNGEEIWSWGSNTEGQLGINEDMEVLQKFPPTECDIVVDSWNEPGENNKILSLSAGGDSSLAIIDTDGDSSNGGEEAWTWGDNTIGQLGNGTSVETGDGNSTNVPVQVYDGDFLNNEIGRENHIVGSGVAGGFDCLIIDTDENYDNGGEEIWSWGNDKESESGSGYSNSSGRQLFPIKALSFADFIVGTNTFYTEPRGPEKAMFTIDVISGNDSITTGYASFDPTKLRMQSHGDDLGQTNFIKEDVIDDLKSTYTYEVVGLESNSPYDGLTLVYDDGENPERVFELEGTIKAGYKSIEINASSFKTSNPTPESIEFTIDVTSGDETEHYEIFNPEELKVEYNGEFSFGNTEWVSGEYFGTGDQTNTYTYRIDGLDPNKTYDNLKIVYQYQTIQLYSSFQTIARKPEIKTDTFNILNAAFHDMYFEIDVLSGDGTGEYYSFDPEKLIFKSNGEDLQAEYINNSQNSPNKGISSEINTYEYYVDDLIIGEIYDNLSFVYEGEETFLDEGISFQTLNPYDNISMDFTTIDNVEIDYTSIDFSINILYTDKLPYDIETQTKMEFYSDGSDEPKGEAVLKDFESVEIPDPNSSMINEEEIQWFEATVTYSIQNLNPGTQFEDMKLKMWSLDNHGVKNEIIGQTSLPSSYWGKTNPLVYMPEESSSFEEFDIKKNSFKFNATINSYDGNDFEFIFNPETDVKLYSDNEELEISYIGNVDNIYTYEVKNLSPLTTYKNFDIEISYYYFDNNSSNEGSVSYTYTFINIISTTRNILMMSIGLIFILLILLLIISIYGYFENKKLKMKIIYKTPENAIIVLNKIDTGIEQQITQLSLVDRDNHLVPYSILSLSHADGVISHQMHSGEIIDFSKYQGKVVLLVNGTLGMKYKNLYFLDQNYAVFQKIYGKLKF